MTAGVMEPKQSTDGYDAIAAYWNEHIHDLSIATHPIGSKGFFDELDAYRFDKLRYLPEVVDFSGYSSKKLLEVGCGIGIDLARFAAGGTDVTGIDLASRSIELSEQNFEQRGLQGDFEVMNGEAMTFDDASFDVVYAHGVLQYTMSPERMVAEIHRVLKPGGSAILMGYNRRSWLRLMSVMLRTPLEHMDAPGYRMFTAGEMRAMTKPFSEVRLTYERFPVPTKLHKGLKATLYNGVFVRGFNLLPRFVTGWTGWHLMVFARK